MDYHIVLTPPPHVATAVKNFAQEHFSKGHMGYCVGSDGHLPHVTIVQLSNVPEDKVSKIFTAISRMEWDCNTPLEFGDYYHNSEKPYNGVNIHMSAELRDLHDKVIDFCADNDLQIDNKIGDDYWPHMTFSKNQNRLPESVWLPDELKGVSSGWTLEFGHMGEHGVYLGRYNPK